MYCGSVIVVYEFGGRVLDVYGVLVIFGSVVVVCEYDRSVVDGYWDEKKIDECGCVEEREKVRGESRGEGGIR